MRSRASRREEERPGVASRSDVGSIPAILILIVATVFAVVLIPHDVEPRNALFWPAVVMALGLGIIPIVAMIGNTKDLFLAHHMLVLAPIYWLLLDLLQKVYDMEGVVRQDAVLAFVAIGLFACGVWLGVLGKPWRQPRLVQNAAAMELTPDALFMVVVAAFVLGMGRFAIPCGFDPGLMYQGLLADRWAAPWARGQFGGWDAFTDHLGYFGYLSPSFTVTLAMRRGWLNLRTLIALAMAVTMTAFMAQDGGRRNVGVVVGMAIISWVLMQRKHSPRTLAIVAVSCGVLLYFMQEMLYYRNVGFQAALSEEEKQDIEKRNYVHVDDNFYRLCQIIQIIPQQQPHVYLKFVTYVLVRPVPRVFWPGKPIDGGFDISEAVGARGVSLSMSIVGELYMSGGLLAVLLGGWFYGRLAGMANQLILQAEKVGAVILYGTMVMALFAGVRSLIDLVLISYVVLAWIALCWLFQFFSGAGTRVRPVRRTNAR